MVFLDHSLRDGKKRFLVGLVVDDKKRHRKLVQSGDELLFGFAESILGDDQNGAVDFLEHLEGLPYPLLTQLAHIVDAGRVDEHTRPDAEDFDAFLDRVGGGTCRVAHDGDVLSREAVDEAAFAAIPATENADMRFQVFGHYFQFLKGFFSSCEL